MTAFCAGTIRNEPISAAVGPGQEPYNSATDRARRVRRKHLHGRGAMTRNLLALLLVIKPEGMADFMTNGSAIP
jgi:hypothetical protein